MPRFTEKTIVDPAALRCELARIRERGWAVDDEEHTVGMRCVAATIHNEHGEVIAGVSRSEEHTSELQSLMRISYAVFCLKKKKINKNERQKEEQETEYR